MAKKDRALRDSRAKAIPDIAEKAVETVEDGSSTLSTRFEPKQRELIEAAARLMGWSPAKLLRDAAVQRAADIVNSAGSMEHRLYSLAGQLLKQLFNPEVEYSVLDEELKRLDRRTVAFNSDGIRDREQPDDVTTDVYDIHPLRPHNGDLRQMRAAFESSGTRLVEMLLQRWDLMNGQDNEYKPKVSVKELLGGESKSQSSEKGGKSESN